MHLPALEPAEESREDNSKVGEEEGGGRWWCIKEEGDSLESDDSEFSEAECSDSDWSYLSRSYWYISWYVITVWNMTWKHDWWLINVFYLYCGITYLQKIGKNYNFQGKIILYWHVWNSFIKKKYIQVTPIKMNLFWSVISLFISYIYYSSV